MAEQIPRSPRRYWVLLVIFAVVIYVVVPQLGQFHSSWRLLRHPSAAWTALAIGLTFSTYLAAAGTYYFLALKPLRYVQLVLVELAAMFVNRFLPGGIGAIGANYAYFRHQGYAPGQAGSLVALNNLMGVLGHLSLAMLVSIFFSRHLSSGGILPAYRVQRFIEIAALLSVLLLATVLVVGKRRLAKTAREIHNQALDYKKEPGRLLAALATSVSLTSCNVACLQACALALGVHLPFAGLFVIFSLGVGAGTATPTPGGLGGFETGLLAGFVAYHVTVPVALAAALLYRIVSYWLPLIAGGAALVTCQKKRLFMA